MSEIKTYRYKLLKETNGAIQIEVPTRDKKKIYQFYIPKSACEHIERIREIDSKGNETKVVEIQIESKLFYKFTWMKIQKWMQERGLSVKTWDKRFK